MVDNWMVKVIYVMINCILNAVLLLLGNNFIVIAFMLSIINIILIPILFRKESNLTMAVLTVILMLLFSVIQMLDGYYNCDDGGYAFMYLFTVSVTIIPMSISAVVHMVIHICRKFFGKTKKRGKTGDGSLP